MDTLNNNLETLRLAGEDDSDAEQEKEQQSTAQEPGVPSHEDYMALTQRNQEMKLTIERLKNQLRQIQEQAQRAQEQHTQELNTSKRLRYQRDQYRSTARDLANQVTLLQQQQQQREIEELYDSDKEGESPLQRTKNTLFSQQTSKKTKENTANAPISHKFHTSHTQIEPTLSAQQGNNKYYPDVPDFYGDRSKWDSWKLHLDAKFRASGLLYPTHQSRIDYIRDHCKSTAFDVIKARCLDNSYYTPEEVLKDLDNMFGEFDAYESADAMSGSGVVCRTDLISTMNGIIAMKI